MYTRVSVLTAHAVAVLNEQRVSETAAALFTPRSSPRTSIIKVAIDPLAGEHQDISHTQKMFKISIHQSQFNVFLGSENDRKEAQFLAVTRWDILASILED